MLFFVVGYGYFLLLVINFLYNIIFDLNFDLLQIFVSGFLYVIIFYYIRKIFLWKLKKKSLVIRLEIVEYRIDK